MKAGKERPDRVSLEFRRSGSGQERNRVAAQSAVFVAAVGLLPNGIGHRLVLPSKTKHRVPWLSTRALAGLSPVDGTIFGRERMCRPSGRLYRLMSRPLFCPAKFAAERAVL